MPNCDFYAVEQDFEPVLKFVFDDLECRVFESYSAYDSELVEFTEFDQIWNRGIGRCLGKTRSMYLQLWPVKASKNVTIQRFNLDPVATKGATFRYRVNGWGLIQLYLGGASESGVISSHTNHNSEKRALKWSNVSQSGLGDPGDWDWSVVKSQSGKLNRCIRRNAVSKINSRPVLPHAQHLIESGAKPLV